MNELINVLPAIALRGTTILPDMIVHFDISRDKSVKAVEEAMLHDQRIFLVTQKDVMTEDPGMQDVYRIGTIGKIKQVVKMPKHVLRILVEGLERAELLSFINESPFLEAETAMFERGDDILAAPNAKEAMVRNLKDMFLEFGQENNKISAELTAQILDMDNLEKVVDQIAINLPLPYEERQKILEAVSLSERYELLGVIMSNEIEIMRIRADLQSKIKERIDKNQKEYILREQIKLIREELGEDNVVSDSDRFMEELKKIKASKEIKEKIEEEIKRFRSVGNHSSESAVIRGYIETLLKMPWDKVSKDNNNIKKAKEVLEADHYGLEKVKERIL